MKRWVVRICVLLVVGAIVNVAVAWGCTMQGTVVHLPESVTSPMQMQEIWHSRRRSDFPKNLNLEMSYVAQTRGVQDLTLLAMPEEDDAQMYVISWRSAGWPLFAVGGDEAAVYLRSGGVISRESSGMIQLAEALAPLISLPDERYPLLPLWPGFAINTVFYAVVLWLLFAAPFALRRRRRIKRGLCPNCAYDLRGSASQSCPECGATK